MLYTSEVYSCDCSRDHLKNKPAKNVDKKLHCHCPLVLVELSQKLAHELATRIWYSAYVMKLHHTLYLLQEQKGQKCVILQL